MTTATFHGFPAAAFERERAVRPARQTWFRRFYDRLVEARMQRARRQVREHLSVLPPDMLERYSLGNLPFVR